MNSKKPPDPDPPDEPFVLSPILTITLPHDTETPPQDSNMDTESSNRKRVAGSPPATSNIPPKIAKNVTGRFLYNKRDNPPYIVHVSLKDQQTSGTVLQPIKFDWDLYSKIVDIRISSLPKVDSHNAHECFSSFSSTISSTADDCFLPKKTPSGRLPPPPWWDRECTDMIKARNEAEKTFNYNMNLDNLIAFKRILAKSRKFLKKKKREGWSKFCSSLNPSTPVSTVWKKVKSFRSSLAPASYNNITKELGYQFFSKIAPGYVPRAEECNVDIDDADNMADPMNMPFIY
ncbi:hypothetical protein PYW08_015568 [Mythimna loreyi]|uniref:Uncharacterized protein n=1 Tax=Mythimna loreyi TaxID=667449 RepID=A0ACC2QWJ6_9NEOP|nr:hypothetical protein PYW08_015568 [Mythimna loreyi]